MVETDKYASGLIYYYQDYFSSYDGKIERVLEVGIYKGGFLYFLDTQLFKDRNVKYYGIDIKIANTDERLSELIKDRRLVLFAANQNKTAQLVACAEEIKQDGLLDIVIDDGAHGFNECVNTFNTFWPLVREGGFYFIEDWAAYMCYPDNPTYKSMRRVCDFILDNAKDSGFHDLEFIFHPAPRFSVIAIRKNYV